MGLLKSKQLNTTEHTTSLATNVFQLMEKNKVSDSQLARALGLPYNTIKRITAGETTDPKISTLILIADYFDVGVDELLGKKCQAAETLYSHPISVPVLPWNDVLNLKSVTRLNPSNWKDWQLVAPSSAHKLSPHAYSLRSRKSMEPRFPAGTLFIIDPDEKPDDSDLVLVKIIATEEVTLRELEIDPPTCLLHAVNGSSNPISFQKEHHEIMGTAILTIFHSRE